MKDKINVKKLLKLAGHLVVIAALAFVVKKIIDMDIKLSDLSSPRVIAAFAVGLVIQTAQIIIACWSWLMFTRSLSGQKIPYSAAMPVFTRSNIYKYLPGNVFQYVGRNQLAADMSISHVDVACATILDVLFCVFWTGIISVVLLGGRVAEAIILGDISTGASNDIERATNLVFSMITKYGMSEKLGPITYGSSDGEVFLGKEFGHNKTYSEETAAKIDAEVKEYITDGYQKTEKILREHISELHTVAKFLFEHEKMTGEQFILAMEGKPIPEAADEEADDDEADTTADAKVDLSKDDE